MNRIGIVAALAAVIAAWAVAAPAQPVEERDHVWAVDRDGRPTPLYGCWQLVSATHPHSAGAIGEIVVFSAEPLPNAYRDEGIMRAPDGLLWTRVALQFPGEPEYVVLERIDTLTSPQQWHEVAVLAADGSHTPEYASTAAEFAGGDPDVDIRVYNRVSCTNRPQPAATKD